MVAGAFLGKSPPRQWHAQESPEKELLPSGGVGVGNLLHHAGDKKERAFPFYRNM